MLSLKSLGEAEDKVLEEEEQFNKQLEASLQVGLQTVPNAEGVATGLTDLLSSLCLGTLIGHQAETA